MIYVNMLIMLLMLITELNERDITKAAVTVGDRFHNSKWGIKNGQWLRNDIAPQYFQTFSGEHSNNSPLNCFFDRFHN